MLSRTGSTIAKCVGLSKVASRAFAPALPSASRFCFSTLVEQKGLGEEAKFIREQEIRRKEELQANLEKIMAHADSDEEVKAQLQSILDGKKEGKPSFISKYGLDDWKAALPLAGILLIIPAIQNQYLIMTSEVYYACLAMLGTATLYKQVGPMITAELDAKRQEAEQDLMDLDDCLTAQLEESAEADEAALTLAEDYKSLYELEDSLGVAKAEVLNYQAEHKFRDDVVQKLESLHALEEAALGAMRARIITTVKHDVVTTFKSDKSVQDAALAQAIAVLGAGPGAKLGKDVVGAAFAKSIKTYRENYQKLPPGSDEILVQLEKDVANVILPPVVQAKGGNIYA